MPLIIFGSIFFIMGIVITFLTKDMVPSGTCPQEVKDIKTNKIASKVITISGAMAVLVGIIIELLN